LEEGSPTGRIKEKLRGFHEDRRDIVQNLKGRPVHAEKKKIKEINWLASSSTAKKRKKKGNAGKLTVLS